MKRKRILLLITNLDYGGAQRSFSKLSLELNKYYDLYTSVFNTYDGIAYPYEGQLLDLDIPGSSNVIGKISNFIKRVLRIRKLKKRHDIEVCISFLEGADYVNVLSGVGEKKILSIRGSKSHDETIQGWLGVLRRKFLIPWLYQYADQIVTVNHGILNELKNEYFIKKVPIQVLPNWYDINLLEKQAGTKLDKTYTSLFAKPVISSFGRLAIEKGYDHLLKVYSILKAKGDCKLLLIGDGPFKENLFSICEEFGLKYYNWESNNILTSEYDVYFLGYHDDSLKFISKSQIFVMTSSSEGFPNALAEAMVCNVPVVSTDCPNGPREILSALKSKETTLLEAEYSNYGILMPTFDKIISYELWSDTLIKLLLDDELRIDYAKRAATRIHQFQKDKVIQDWQKIIDSEDVKN